MDVIFMGTPDFAVATLDSLERAGHHKYNVVSCSLQGIKCCHGNT